jgi:hypothetical protein
VRSTPLPIRPALAGKGLDSGLRQSA